MGNVLESAGQLTRDVRFELDRIAHLITKALAGFDTEPNPAALDVRLAANGPCRICRLLWDRGRSIAAFVERDPELLDTATTRGVLNQFYTDLENHKKTTLANAIMMYPNDASKYLPHDPMTNYIRAMVENVKLIKGAQL